MTVTIGLVSLSEPSPGTSGVSTNNVVLAALLSHRAVRPDLSIRRDDSLVIPPDVISPDTLTIPLQLLVAEYSVALLASTAQLTVPISL
jgi:hypothetical protein